MIERRHSHTLFIGHGIQPRNNKHINYTIMKKNSTSVSEGIVGGAGMGAVGGTASAICTASQVAMAGATVTAGVIAAHSLFA